MTEPWYTSVLERLAALPDRALAAIDGRCCAGKTTLASALEKELGCAVFRMDDFYLPPDDRSPDWMAHPGGNMDFSRFAGEVLAPLGRGEAVHYRPYDCKAGAYRPEKLILPGKLALVEGSYACHPALGEVYDLKIFLTCTREAQERRLRAREREWTSQFLATWVPLEERYLAEYPIEQSAHLILDTSNLF